LIQEHCVLLRPSVLCCNSSVCENISIFLQGLWAQLCGSSYHMRSAQRYNVLRTRTMEQHLQHWCNHQLGKGPDESRFLNACAAGFHWPSHVSRTTACVYSCTTPPLLQLGGKASSKSAAHIPSHWCQHAMALCPQALRQGPPRQRSFGPWMAHCCCLLLLSPVVALIALLLPLL
jgi:hypothetical protein